MEKEELFRQIADADGGVSSDSSLTCFRDVWEFKCSAILCFLG